jgi:hypothetical protein
MPPNTRNITSAQRSKDIIISSIISIAITIVFGYYFLIVGDKEREPTFYVDPVRTVIVDKTNAAEAPLRLLKPNNDTIQSDVVSAYFYFFNQGKATIKRENIYAPLKVKLDTGAEILYFKVLKTAREVCGIRLSKDSTNQFLNLDFNALEQNDGFVGQLIFEGRTDSPITIEGGIDGAKDFETELASINPVYFLIAIVIFLVAAYIFLIVSRRNSKPMPKLLFFFSALPVLYLLLMFYKTEWFIDHKVPESLRMDHYVQHGKKQVFDLPSWFR